ncbi:uncharacterized protein LOC134232271 [Saccostrea cucullata]|uniref:uncharacterized protein LOC134232271 n=1 Tax=Saccostrea cuccullata TaxID=36930 RepID=UPI002ED5972A
MEPDESYGKFSVIPPVSERPELTNEDAELLLSLISDNKSELVPIELKPEPSDHDVPGMDPFHDDDDSLLASITASDLIPHLSQTPLQMDLQQPADPGLPPPETPSTSYRFRKVTEKQIKTYQEMTQSKNTKKHTKWGIKILDDWHLETFNDNIDLSSVSAEELASKLERFYCEARPSKAKTPNEEYHKNTLKGIRAAINRRLSDLRRDIDIVNDKTFKMANKCLTSLLKQRMTEGTSRPTKHKEIIPKPDLQKISSFLETAYSSPINLRLAMWYTIAIHFVSRGLEFHHQLKRDSFEFKTDENGLTYVCLTHETKQKNYQGGLDKHEMMADKRMYETQSKICPVQMLKFFLSKTPITATNLFNKCVREAISNPDQELWYNTHSLSQKAFVNFLPDICKMAGCQRYTAHNLRATAIQTMNDAGFEARHIMYMSGHRNEASIRSYCRELSSDQKQVASATLSTITEAENENSTSVNTESCQQIATASSDIVPQSFNSDRQIAIATPSSAIVTQSFNSDNSTSSSFLSSTQTGFLSSSRFINCTLTFNMAADK